MAFQVYDSKDAIPEAQREHYVERGGKWHPDVPGYEAERAKTAELAAKVAEFRDNNRTQYALIEQFKAAGGDPAQVKKMHEELEELKRKTSGVDDANVEAEIKRRLGPREQELLAKEQALQKPLKDKDSEITGLSATVEELVIGQMVRDTIARYPELGIQPTAFEDAMPVARKFFRVEKGADGAFVPVAYEKTAAGEGKRFSGRRSGEPYDGRDFFLDHRDNRPHWFSSEGGGATGSKTNGALRGNVLETSDPAVLGSQMERIASGEVEVRVVG